MPQILTVKREKAGGQKLTKRLHCVVLEMQAGFWMTLLLIFLIYLLPGKSNVLVVTASRGYRSQGSFVRATSNGFALEHHPFYVNGFNAYWLPSFAVDEPTRANVTSVLRQASSLGLSVCRTWAFRDGGYHAIQVSPGVYNEEAFQGLDYVLSQAYNNGVKLVLALANNYEDYGGKAQYVKWAQEAGHTSVSSEDEFFRNPVIKEYYKSYVETVLRRVNTITKVAYRDDPTIFAWELMNEARCMSDPSGDTMQTWIEEMAAFVKSIDSNHLLAIGTEGFYGPKDWNRGLLGSWAAQMGTDFVRQNQIPNIDFATVHSYPDLWLPSSTFDEQLEFVTGWILNHIEDTGSQISKPILFSEFGKSDKEEGYVEGQRDEFLATIYATIYSAASNGSPVAGGLVWQLVPEGNAKILDDGFAILLSQSPSTAMVIASQSQKVSRLNSRLLIHS